MLHLEKIFKEIMTASRRKERDELRLRLSQVLTLGSSKTVAFILTFGN